MANPKFVDWHTAKALDGYEAAREWKRKLQTMRERVLNVRYGLFTPAQWSGK